MDRIKVINNVKMIIKSNLIKDLNYYYGYITDNSNRQIEEKTNYVLKDIEEKEIRFNNEKEVSECVEKLLYVYCNDMHYDDIE